MKKIPKSFKLFGTTINVIIDNQRCNDKNLYGASHYGKSVIMLSTHHNAEELSEDRKLDVFYHEKVHIILDNMNENELTDNEKFVDIFAKLLRQSDETMTY